MFKKYILIVYICLQILLFYVPLYAGDITGLQGAWLLDEESGVRVDQTANNNDLTDNNTVLFATGQFGNAADFESANSEYLSITDGAQTGLDMTSSYTATFWTKVETLYGDQTFVTKTTASLNDGYSLRTQASGLLELINASGASSTTPAGVITAGTWYHIAFVFDTVNNLAIFYVDGTVVDTNSYATDPTNNTGEFRIGASVNGSHYFDGLIDEAAVFSRVLDVTEINDIKNNGLVSFIQGEAVSRKNVIVIT